MEVVHQPPGRSGVQQVEVTGLHPSVPDHAIPPSLLILGTAAQRPDPAITGGRLMRILSVAQLVGPLQRQVQGRRQKGSLSLVEPAHNSSVVGGGPGEGLSRQSLPGGCAQLSPLLDLLEYGRVVQRIGYHPHVVMVFGGRPDQGRASYVDVFRAGSALEGVQIHHHQVDRIDAVLFHLGLMGGIGSVGQDAAVNLGVERHHPMSQQGRITRVVGQVGHRPTGGLQRGRCPSTGQELPSGLGQSGGKLHNPGLVVHRKQCPSG